MQVKQFLKCSRQGIYMRRQLLQKCWSESYKYILDKFLAVHVNLIFLDLKIEGNLVSR